MAEEHTIRPMRLEDVEPAAEVMINGGWGDRRRFLRFCVERPRFVPLVAVVDDRIVGTGVPTINGPVGWVGMIFVDEALRGRGIGTSLTQAVIDELNRAGCASLVLLASPSGQPIYERLGFKSELDYRLIAAPGLGGPRPGAGEGQHDEPSPRRLRPYAHDDLPAILAIDAAATGEDRAHLLEASADPATGIVALGPDGRVVGFEVRAPWGTHPMVAPELVDGVRMLEDRRTRTAAGAEVRTALPDANRAGLTTLENLGWRHERELVRMIRGAPIHWQPSAIWGQFNFALG
ncbi:MAG: GNAT family N-acetyltransferase [Chloroflexota bacterium]|nr:GNAT family N-acetyltransferase [Chloroflexota bacterium]